MCSTRINFPLRSKFSGEHDVTPKVEEHEEDIWNNFYRSILSCFSAAKAFGDDKPCNSVRECRVHFEMYWEKNSMRKKSNKQ
jgi:hypothetical protein